MHRGEQVGGGSISERRKGQVQKQMPRPPRRGSPAQLGGRAWEAVEMRSRRVGNGSRGHAGFSTGEHEARRGPERRTQGQPVAWPSVNSLDVEVPAGAYQGSAAAGARSWEGARRHVEVVAISR